MAKIESVKMGVSLDNDSKRIIRDLTKAIDRLSRTLRPYEVKDGTRRLIEPADELGKYKAGEISDAELEEMKQRRPEMFMEPEGGSEKVKPSEVEPALRFKTPDGRFVEDALREEVTKKLGEWDSASPGISNVFKEILDM